MKMEDRLVFEIDGRLFGLSTSVVDSVIEVERVFFLPGRKGIVNGVVSFKGDPVTVVDARMALTGGGNKNRALPQRIIVVREKNRSIGLDIGTLQAYCLMAGEQGAGAKPVEDINWIGLFNEAQNILSS